nr:hypothetical protein [Hyunsoonleella aquatilis]
MTNQNNKSALAILVAIFFFLGFIVASNGVFIPFCKTYFNIDQFQSQLVDFAFYGAYYIGGLFCSIIWSCIFTLGIASLGKYNSQGSAFLIVMILSGTITLPFQGKLADVFNIQFSYWIAVACFTYFLFFASGTKTVLDKQNVTY